MAILVRLESLCTIPKCSYAAFHGLNVLASGVWAAYQNCISRNYTDHFWLLAAHPHTVTGSLSPRVFPQVWQQTALWLSPSQCASLVGWRLDFSSNVVYSWFKCTVTASEQGFTDHCMTRSSLRIHAGRFETDCTLSLDWEQHRNHAVSLHSILYSLRPPMTSM